MEFEEEILHGGNVNDIVRIGGTVRRAASGNPLVPQLLRHLEAQGFHGAPRFLGTDDMGRDTFSYLPGEVAGNDYPDNPHYMWTDQSLMGIGKLIRGYHDASQGLAAGLPRQSSRYLSDWRNEVICHNDAALYNIVFREGNPVALIDFDMAAPGPRIWDIAYTLYTCVPMAGFSPVPNADRTTPYAAGLHAGDRKRRLHLFFQAYGMEQPDDLKHIVIQRIQALCDTLKDHAAAGNAAFIKMVDEGHLAHYEFELIFLADHFDEWL